LAVYKFIYLLNNNTFSTKCQHAATINVYYYDKEPALAFRPWRNKT